MDKNPPTEPAAAVAKDEPDLPPPPMQLEADPAASAPAAEGSQNLTKAEVKEAVKEAPLDTPKPSETIAPTPGATSALPKDLPLPLIPAEPPKDPDSPGGPPVRPIVKQTKAPKIHTTKPILVIVVSVLLFVLLCAAAYLAYSKSS